MDLVAGAGVPAPPGCGTWKPAEGLAMSNEIGEIWKDPPETGVVGVVAE